MIHDRLNKLVHYLPDDFKGILTAFIQGIVPDMEEKQYNLLGDKLYAKVMSYDTKPKAECLLESHRRYIDIQLSIIGAEGISVYTREELEVEKPYQEDEDVVLYKKDNSIPYIFVENKVGYFTLLYPWDAHTPKEQIKGYTKVKKIVIKLDMDLVLERKRTLKTQISRTHFLLGEINKCVLVKECDFCMLSINGWFLPESNYNRIEIWKKESRVLLGTAKIGIERSDVSRKFPFFNSHNAGFTFEHYFDVWEDEKVLLFNVFKDDSLIDTMEAFVDIHDLGIKIDAVDMLKQLEQIDLKDEKYVDLIGNQSKEVRDTVRKWLRDKMEQSKSIETYIEYFQYMFRFELCKSKDIMEYHKKINQVGDPVNRFWLSFMDFPRIILHHPQYLYSDYYLDHRESVNRIISELYNGHISIQQKNIGYIAVLASTLGNQNLGSVMLISNVANELARRNYKVKIFVADIAYYVEEQVKIPPIYKVKQDSKRFSKEHLLVINSNVEIIYNTGQDIYEKLNHYINTIVTYNPEFIVDLSWEFSAAAPVLYGKYPIIHAPLGDYTSSMMFDKYIARDKERCNEVNKIYRAIPMDKIEAAPILLFYNASADKEYARKDYQIKESAFVLVTAGNRLRYELSDEFLEKMKCFLEQNEDMCWIVVGSNLDMRFIRKMKYLLQRGKVIEWGYEQNLPSLYKICDVYFEPDRMGGGGSGCWAAHCGIPWVLTSHLRDVTPAVGLENCIEGGYDEMFKFVLQLAENKEMYREESQKWKEWVRKPEFSIESYVDAIERAFTSCESGGYKK